MWPTSSCFVENLVGSVSNQLITVKKSLSKRYIDHVFGMEMINFIYKYLLSRLDTVLNTGNTNGE